ncbi:unnamed protein product [Brassicogethes aeneus]|uniref:Uncharacterized protein n=1 Tax=Brassicogethes aeneus TaxID=1431903 RepID=A0A9P0FNK5_BRAAE|nr:unnamed protein product [Brassicogethes aeneus]
MEEENMEIDFRPITKEQEPSIPAPKSTILQLGRECQRLGTTSFNKIRYSEVHKKLHASPIFSALKVNPQLPPKPYSNQYQDQLTKIDSCLGTILHGMLLQREAFSNAISEIIKKHPGAKPDILTNLVKEGDFRQFSDDLIQYVCGRRAEIIDQRKKIIPKNEYVASLLENIPPSETSLFDEKPFAEFYQQHGRFFRSFNEPSTSKIHKTETTNRTNYNARRPQFRAKTSTTREPWKTSNGSHKKLSSSSEVHKSYKKGIRPNK